MADSVVFCLTGRGMTKLGGRLLAPNRALAVRLSRLVNSNILVRFCLSASLPGPPYVTD